MNALLQPSSFQPSQSNAFASNTTNNTSNMNMNVLIQPQNQNIFSNNLPQITRIYHTTTSQQQYLVVGSYTTLSIEKQVATESIWHTVIPAQIQSSYQLPAQLTNINTHSIPKTTLQSPARALPSTNISAQYTASMFRICFL